MSEVLQSTYLLRRITVDCTDGGAGNGSSIVETRSPSARDKYSEREESIGGDEEHGMPSPGGDSESMSSEYAHTRPGKPEGIGVRL